MPATSAVGPRRRGIVSGSPGDGELGYEWWSLLPCVAEQALRGRIAAGSRRRVRLSALSAQLKRWRFVSSRAMSRSVAAGSRRRVWLSAPKCTAKRARFVSSGRRKQLGRGLQIVGRFGGRACATRARVLRTAVRAHGAVGRIRQACGCKVFGSSIRLYKLHLAKCVRAARGL
eukprot:IDg3959t1